MSGRKLLLVLVRYGLALVYGLLVLVRTLFGILLRPRSTFARVARPVPPAVLDGPRTQTKMKGGSSLTLSNSSAAPTPVATEAETK